MHFKKPSCDVGMYFGNFHDYTVKIGNYKKLRVPSGKCRVLSVSGLHNDSKLCAPLQNIVKPPKQFGKSRFGYGFFPLFAIIQYCTYNKYVQVYITGTI